MKAIMKSIRPQHGCNILNLIKELEISTTAPKEWKDYLSGKTDKKPEPIDVYIYVTQNHKHAGWKNRDTLKRDSHDGKPTNHFQLWTDDMVEDKDKLNGKVVAKFTLNEVEEIKRKGCDTYTDTMFESLLLDKSCLDLGTICHYLKHEEWQENEIVVGYAWHIDNLVIFDEPKEISEFYTTRLDEDINKRFDNSIQLENGTWVKPLTNAPQSWCYIEV